MRASRPRREAEQRRFPVLRLRLGGEGDEVAAGLAADDAVHSLAPPLEVEHTFQQAAIGLDLGFDADLDTIAVVNDGQAAQLGVRKGDLVKNSTAESSSPGPNFERDR